MYKKVFGIIVAIIVIIILVIIGIFFKVKNENNVASLISTSPYIPSGVNIASGNDIETLASNLEFNRSPENVTIEVLKDTITRESAEILITDNNEDNYGWGVEFNIEKKVNENWEELDTISDDLTWIDIAYETDEDNQLKMKVNYGEYYGTLENGTYRIVKPVYDNGYIYFYSDEFEIK